MFGWVKAKGPKCSLKYPSAAPIDFTGNDACSSEVRAEP